MTRRLMILQAAALCCLFAVATFATTKNIDILVAHGDTFTTTTYHAFGDSITAFGPPTGYPYLISVDKGLTLTNRAIGRYETCWMNIDQIFPNEDPQATGNPIYTMMGGTNDQYNYGVGPHETIYKNCLQAAISWLTIPNTSKVLPSSCSHTGTWAVTTDVFPPGGAVSNNNAGDTITCPISVVNGVIYVWMHIGFGFTYSIDGGPAVPGSFDYSLTLKNSVNVLRVAGLTNGPHTITITNTWGSGGLIMGPVGTPAASGACCRMIVTGVLKEQLDADSERTAVYNADVQSTVSLMQGDGLNVSFADVRAFVNESTEMTDTLHPNATGLRHIADAIEAVW